MDKSKNIFTLLGVGIGIGVILTVILIAFIGAKPTGIRLGPVEFDIPTAPPTPQLSPTTFAFQVEVYADKEWQDTGAFVSEGQSLRINYLRGQWSQCVGGEACSYVDANGLDFESPQDNVMASGCKDARLIARVSYASPFCIGGQFYGKAEQSGHLQLRMNDASAGDNAGSVIVSIEVENQ